MLDLCCATLHSVCYNFTGYLEFRKGSVAA